MVIRMTWEPGALVVRLLQAAEAEHSEGATAVYRVLDRPVTV
jgi:hypothetical protein